MIWLDIATRFLYWLNFLLVSLGVYALLQTYTDWNTWPCIFMAYVVTRALEDIEKLIFEESERVEHG